MSHISKQKEDTDGEWNTYGLIYSSKDILTFPNSSSNLITTFRWIANNPIIMEEHEMENIAHALYTANFYGKVYFIENSSKFFLVTASK